MTDVSTQPMAGLLVEGADARAFSQSQFSSDFKAMCPGQWQWSCCLSAQGRVLALFAAACLEEHCFLLVLPADRQQALREHLSRFIFRSKVLIRPALPLLACERADGLARPTGADTAANCQPASNAEQGALLAVDGAELSIVWGGDSPELVLDAEAVATRLARRGLPWIDSTLADRYTAHMLGLERHGAISLVKGCYPGQEIVARTHYLGRSKRRLYRVAGSLEPVPALPCKLHAPSETEGKPGDALGELLQWHPSPEPELESGIGLAILREPAPGLVVLGGTGQTLSLLEAQSSPEQSDPSS